MSPRPSWIDSRVDVLLAELSELGMSMSRAAGAELVRERVDWVATQMRIGKAAARPYLTDEAVKGLAESIVFSMAEEAPGVDVLHSPRTAEVPVAVIGRVVSALAESTLVRLFERDDVEHLRPSIAQLTQALSAVGLVLADHDSTDGAVARFPPALLLHVARYLDAAADLALDGALPPDFDPQQAASLAASFRRDATTLRGFTAG